jgi:hypothetical protein
VSLDDLWGRVDSLDIRARELLLGVPVAGEWEGKQVGASRRQWGSVLAVYACGFGAVDRLPTCTAATCPLGRPPACVRHAASPCCR